MTTKRTTTNSQEGEAGRKIREYLAEQPPNARKILRKMHAAVREAAPQAEEHFSYGIPGFRLDGKALVWYAGFKGHVSFYPMGEAIRRANAKYLEGLETSKGTIRFPLDRPPSDALVKRLVKARVAEVRAKANL